MWLWQMQLYQMMKKSAEANQRLVKPLMRSGNANKPMDDCRNPVGHVTTVVWPLTWMPQQCSVSPCLIVRLSSLDLLHSSPDLNKTRCAEHALQVQGHIGKGSRYWAVAWSRPRLRPGTAKKAPSQKSTAPNEKRKVDARHTTL